MPLPFPLPFGIVSVYGLGSTTSSSGIVPANNRFLFGTIDQVYDGGSVFVYGGDAVMFDKNDITEVVYYNNFPYTLIQARLVTVETVPVV